MIGASSRLWQNKKEGLGQARVARLPVSTQSRAWAPLGWHFHLPIVEPPTFLFIIPRYLIIVSPFMIIFSQKNLWTLTYKDYSLLSHLLFFSQWHKTKIVVWSEISFWFAQPINWHYTSILTHGKDERSCNRKTTDIAFVHSPYNDVLIDVLFLSESFCTFTIKGSWASAVNTKFLNWESFVVSWNRQLAGVRYVCTLLFALHRVLVHFDFRATLQEIPMGCYGCAVVTIVFASPG